MFNEQHRQAIGYGIEDELTLSVELYAASYVDPNLIVLLFLLLFCLLYVLILALDTVWRADRTPREEQPERVSKRS